MIELKEGEFMVYWDKRGVLMYKEKFLNGIVLMMASTLFSNGIYFYNPPLPLISDMELND